MKIGVAEPIPIEISDEEAKSKSKGKLTKPKMVPSAALEKKPQDVPPQKSHDFRSWENMMK